MSLTFRPIWSSTASGLLQESLEVERPRVHGDAVAACRPRPFLTRPVAVELDAVPVRILEVHGLADAVVGRPDADACVEDAPDRTRQCGPCRIANGEVIEAGRPARRGR